LGLPLKKGKMSIQHGQGYLPGNISHRQLQMNKPRVLKTDFLAQ